MTALSTMTPDAMSLFSDVVRHPAFAEKDFDRIKKRTLIGIQQSTDNVGVLASRVGPKLLFGDTPYGMPANGTIESVSALTRDQLAAFYKANYGPGDTVLVLVGDVTLAQAHELAGKYFGDWSGAPSNAVTLPQAKQPESTYIALIDKPGAPQTAVIAYGVGVPANAPDLPTVDVMNYILGGSFGSRINMNLREVHGYTYGANSRFTSYRSGGTFVAGGLIRTDATAPATKEMMGELSRFATAPVSDEELKSAKAAEIQSLPGEFATTEAIAGALRSTFILDRPLDYYATLPAKYNAVDAVTIQRVAKEDLHPDHLVIVTAGDRSKIEQPLKDLNLGPIEVFDKDGKKE